MPDFSYSQSTVKKPTWNLPSNLMNLSLTDLPKDTTSPISQQRFKEFFNTSFKGWNHIYTDGSKSEMGVGAASATGSHTESASLPKISSIFTA